MEYTIELEYRRELSAKINCGKKSKFKNSNFKETNLRCHFNIFLDLSKTDNTVIHAAK